MLFYCPLEPYKERYTMQWSAPVTGWLERNWVRAGVKYLRVDGEAPAEQRTIKAGCVLDAVGRSRFAFSQVSKLLGLAESGQLTSGDVIYFDDFWHPGIEALPYAFHLLGIKPRMYAFLHAQSVDEFDFTHPMRGWMRHFERGIAAALDGVFVCGPCLKDLVIFGGIAPAEKVHVTGHPFSSEEVMERMPALYRDHLARRSSWDRTHSVVYSSRWDAEKNPEFFLKVAKMVIDKDAEAQFIICTGADPIRSNSPAALAALYAAVKEHPRNIHLRQGLTKEQYYDYLCQAKIQINTADQDFVAITLLESSTAGCYPVYPYFRSFPETFLRRPGFMYNRLDAQDCASMVFRILNSTGLWSPEAIEARAWIHRRYDTSWQRMLKVMGLYVSYGRAVADPYDPSAW